MSKKPNPELRKKWEQRIADYKESGQTQVQWCESNDISIHQFKYWAKRIRDYHHTNNEVNRWVPVVIEDPKPDHSKSLRIQIGSASIEIHPGFNPSLLTEVIKVLKENAE